MIDESRIWIYNYVYGLLYGKVSNNVYSMEEPQELTESDTTDGFIVIRVGQINDQSEFRGNAYAWVRVYVEAYVPMMSRGRLNKVKYAAFENDISRAINGEIDVCTSDKYSIQDDGIISMDSSDNNNANNAYHLYVKSFIVTIN